MIVTLEKVVCPFCGRDMVLRRSAKYAHKNGQAQEFYGCSGYPRCTATCGAHPGGIPSSTPADPETKRARNQAHAAFDPLWKSGKMSRGAAYKILCQVMEMTVEQGHIGFFTAEQCETLIQRLRARGLATEAPSR